MTNTMGTSDGIGHDDWEKLEDLVVDYGDAPLESEEQSIARKALFDYLDLLESKYGPLPSILAAKGDFTDEYEAKEALLGRAYAAAIAMGDTKNSLFVAHSMTELYIDDLVSVSSARQWLERLERHLGELSDPEFEKDAKRFRRVLMQLDETAPESNE